MAFFVDDKNFLANQVVVRIGQTLGWVQKSNWSHHKLRLARFEVQKISYTLQPSALEHHFGVKTLLLSRSWVSWSQTKVIFIKRKICNWRFVNICEVFWSCLLDNSDPCAKTACNCIQVTEKLNRGSDPNLWDLIEGVSRLKPVGRIRSPQNDLVPPFAAPPDVLVPNRTHRAHAKNDLEGHLSGTRTCRSVEARVV